MNKKFKNWLLLVVIAIILIILDGRGYFNWLKRPVGNLVNPTKKVLYLNKVTEGSLKDEESGQLAILEAELVRVRIENKRLRELLETKLPPSYTFVPASILSLSSESMTIDIGEAMDIKEKMLVMGLVREKINGGIVLGRISKVDLMNSKVTLLTNVDSRVNAVTKSGAKGVVKVVEGKMRLMEVLQENALVKDELVLTEGKDGYLPNLVVGRIGEVRKVDTEVFQEAEVLEIFPITSLSQVFVVSL